MLTQKESNPPRYLYTIERWKKPKSESNLQAMCVDWFEKSKIEGILAHVPNHKQGRRELGQLKGFPDLIWCFRGLVVYIEMKMPKGYQTAAQKVFEKRAIENGIPYHVCKGVSQFQKVIMFHVERLELKTGTMITIH